MDFAAIYEKVRLFLKLKRHESAEKLLRFYQKTHGENAKLHNLLGLVFLDASDHENALIHFQNSVDIDPDFEEARINLAICLCDVGSYKLASEKILGGRKDVFVNKKLSLSHYETGLQYQQSLMYPDAVQEFKKSLVLNPRNHQARLALARVYSQRDQWELCSEELEALLKSGEDNSEIRRLLSLSYQSSGRPVDGQSMSVLAGANPPEHSL